MTRTDIWENASRVIYEGQQGRHRQIQRIMKAENNGGSGDTGKWKWKIRYRMVKNAAIDTWNSINGSGRGVG